MSITLGQHYRINSFNLGFIHLPPAEVIVVITQLDHTDDSLYLSPLPLPGSLPDDTFFRIAWWFKKEYPTFDKERSPLTNVTEFEKLIKTGMAVLDEGPGGRATLDHHP